MHPVKKGGDYRITYSGLREGVELGFSYSEFAGAETIDSDYFLEGSSVWMKLTF
ncbi:MAG: hypothetical protein WD046_04215 [Paracoccaceae bacterium]